MTYRRLGIIGDVHAQHHNLSLALQFFAEAGVEVILCVGDVADGEGDVDRCCELLQQSQAVVVRGNHDRWLFEGTMRDMPDATQLAELNDNSRAFLNSLPFTISLETTAGPLLLCHGLQDNDMNKLAADDYGYALEMNDELQNLMREQQFKLVICGHSHRRMVRTIGTVTIINAGTLLPSCEPCFGLIDLDRNEVVWLEFAGDTYYRPMSEISSLAV